MGTTTFRFQELAIGCRPLIMWDVVHRSLTNLRLLIPASGLVTDDNPSLSFGTRYLIVSARQRHRSGYVTDFRCEHATSTGEIW